MTDDEREYDEARLWRVSVSATSTAYLHNDRDDNRYATASLHWEVHRLAVFADVAVRSVEADLGKLLETGIRDDFVAAFGEPEITLAGPFHATGELRLGAATSIDQVEALED